MLICLCALFNVIACMLKNEEQKLKKKMQAFMNDMCHLSMCNGFKYFRSYLRGREELILNISNNTTKDSPLNSIIDEGLRNIFSELSASDSYADLPYNK